ncbi:MAG: membrane protein insertion efficiency factor YidD [Proteobacteria bacterium]|nr:membrane protein insertion efficiency factor YidD [Pseudomonadota bacterium]
MRTIALPAIQFYKRRISPHKGFCCAYRVHLGRSSCSTLGYRAIRRYGVCIGLVVLRRRLTLCGITHGRFRGMHPSDQRGSAPCDLPCDLNCVPDTWGDDCHRASDCLNCCSCDWPSRDKRSDRHKGVYIPPARR